MSGCSEKWTKEGTSVVSFESNTTIGYHGWLRLKNGEIGSI